MHGLYLQNRNGRIGSENVTRRALLRPDYLKLQSQGGTSIRLLLSKCQEDPARMQPPDASAHKIRPIGPQPGRRFSTRTRPAHRPGLPTRFICRAGTKRQRPQIGPIATRYPA